VRLISLESQEEQVVAVSRLPKIAGEGELSPDDVEELPDEGGGEGGEGGEGGAPPAEGGDEPPAE
jgi:hypothetical protein